MADGIEGAGLVVCNRCGEAEGTGLACVVCAQVRIARNQPRTDDIWTTRTGKQPAMDGITNLLRGSKDKETTMRLPMRKPGEPLPPLRREEPEEAPRGSTRGPGRPRGTGHRPEAKCPDCGAKVSGPWRCRKCSGLARRGKAIARRRAGSPPAALEAGPHGDGEGDPATPPAPRPGRMAGIAMQPIAKGGEGWMAVPTTPTLPVGTDAPGPLTLAVVNFFGEVARASDHIEARMVLDRRKLSITVELTLPSAE